MFYYLFDSFGQGRAPVGCRFRFFEWIHYFAAMTARRKVCQRINEFASGLLRIWNSFFHDFKFATSTQGVFIKIGPAAMVFPSRLSRLPALPVRNFFRPRRRRRVCRLGLCLSSHRLSLRLAPCHFPFLPRRGLSRCTRLGKNAHRLHFPQSKLFLAIRFRGFAADIPLSACRHKS